jgi:hydroxyacylglutathione hydrolase
MGITPAELQARIEAGDPPAILDVRSAGEFAGGHVPGAVNVSFWAVVAGAAVPSAPDRELVVYCGHGPRAYMAGASLGRRGYTRITYLTGHMTRWRKDRRPESQLTR